MYRVEIDVQHVEAGDKIETRVRDPEGRTRFLLRATERRGGGALNLHDCLASALWQADHLGAAEVQICSNDLCFLAELRRYLSDGVPPVRTMLGQIAYQILGHFHRVQFGGLDRSGAEADVAGQRVLATCAA